MTDAKPSILRPSVLSSLGGESLARSRVGVQVGGFVVLAALLAQVRLHVEGSPVPITLQTLAVLLAGMLMPPGRAALAMMAYVAAGILMLAVWPAGSLFAAASFAALSATAGYLAGFLLAAPLVSWAAGSSQASVVRLASAGIVGMVVVFAGGCGWLVAVTGLAPAAALASGLWPFLPQEAVKIALAVSVVVCLRRVRRLRGS